MRGHRPTRFRALLATLAVTSALVACTDEEIVFRNRPIFDEPSEAAAGFLGYSDTITGLTVCGNCHIGVQGDWEESGHAEAWADLEDSGHRQAFCEGCHTVNSLGNFVDGETGGHLGDPGARYYDVQCEACHGPGLDHVTNPDQSQPLASVDVGVDLNNGCGECHQGTHHPFVDEWEQSAHSSVVGFAAGRPECASCHRGQGTLAAWGVEDEYLEADNLEHLPVTCAVCHDPHGSDNDAQLRFPINTPDADEHLCARCHDRRTSPDPSSSHGLEPHAPETALLQGEVGWIPPGSIVDQRRIVATHGSEANQGLCAACHVASYEVRDSETGEFLLNATGHLFSAIPCVDAQGIPTASDCVLDETSRSFEGCAVSGCHNSPSGAASVLIVAALDIQRLVEDLRGQLLQVDPGLDAPGGEIDASNPTFTVAEGAFFNIELAEFGGTGRPDPLLAYASAAAHNPFMVRALLIASQDAVEEEYGFAPASRPQAQQP